jgi:hypothetical protein
MFQVLISVNINKKFWEELIRVLSLHTSFEVPEPNLIELTLISFIQLNFIQRN